MLTRKVAGAKAEHHAAFTFRLAENSCRRLHQSAGPFAQVLCRRRPEATGQGCQNRDAGCQSTRGPYFDRLGVQQRGCGKRMADTDTKTRTKVKTRVERPKLHKVILINDDYTPREFVVTVLKAEFRMTEDHAHKVMITAHQRGVCVVAVFTKDVAETKATRATDAGRAKGYPLLFTTEPEE